MTDLPNFLPRFSDDVVEAPAGHGCGVAASLWPGGLLWLLLCVTIPSVPMLNQLPPITRFSGEENWTEKHSRTG